MHSRAAVRPTGQIRGLEENASGALDDSSDGFLYVWYNIKRGEKEDYINVSLRQSNTTRPIRGLRSATIVCLVLAKARLRGHFHVVLSLWDPHPPKITSVWCNMTCRSQTVFCHLEILHLGLRNNHCFGEARISI
jgi:hypothetical protein